MNAQPIESILADHPFFKEIPREHLARVALQATISRFDKGEVIFREGSDARNFYLVLKGRVIIETLLPHQGLVNIQTVEAGEMLGWSWLVPPFRYRFGARTVQPTELAIFNGKHLLEVFEKDPQLGYQFLRRVLVAITERLEQTRLQLLNIYDNPVK